MDNLTHALLGLTINNTLPRKNRATFWVSLVASELPDIDILYTLRDGTDYLLNHRGLSHSIPALIMFAGLITILAKKVFPGSRSRLIFLLALGCLGLHVLFDLFTSWGTQFLAPFYAGWFYLDYLPIVDWVIIVLALLFMALGRWNRFDRRKTAFLAVVLIGVFVLFRAASHTYLVNRLQDAYPGAKVSVVAGFSPLRWKGFVETEETLIRGNVLIHQPGKLTDVHRLKVYPTDISKYRNNVEFMRVTNFFRRPLYAVQGDTLVVNDFYYNFRQVVFPLDEQQTIAGKAVSRDQHSRESR